MVNNEKSSLLSHSDSVIVLYRLTDCDAASEGFVALALALKSNSHLRDICLSGNKIRYSDVKLLSAGLGDPQCKLEKPW